MGRLRLMYVKQNKRLIGIIVVVLVLLFIPLLAMLFTNEVNWNLFDFFVASILLFSAGFSLEFICRKVTKTKTRIVICGLLLLLFFLIWLELAVGVFGTTIAGN